MLHDDVELNDTCKYWKSLLIMCLTFSPFSPVLFSTNFSVLLVATTVWKNYATFVLSEESLFFWRHWRTDPQSTLVTDPSCTWLWLQSHYHQAHSLSDSKWSNFYMLSVGVHIIFFSYPPPLLSFQHQLHNLHYFLHLNTTPYIPPRRIQMKLVYLPVCMRTDVVDITDQDCMSTLLDTRPCWKFGLLAQPLSHHNFLFPNLSHPHRDQVQGALWENWRCE